MTESLPGPDRENLRKLNEIMPSFIAGMAKKKTVGKGITPMLRRPKKVCPVCGLLYEHKFMKASDETDIKTQNCQPCQKQLDDGCVALVCGDKFAFVKTQALEDFAGQIKQISPYVMAAVEKHYGSQDKKPYDNGRN